MRVGLKELNPDRIDRACYLPINYRLVTRPSKKTLWDDLHLPLAELVTKLRSTYLLYRVGLPAWIALLIPDLR